MNALDERPVVLCGDTKYECICYVETGHTEPHVCRCGGSWDLDGSIIAFPDLSAGFGAYPNPDTVS